MTAPILLCGFNDQSDPSIGIVINEADGSILYQNGLPPKLSGGRCDFTNQIDSYVYLPTLLSSAFSLTASMPKLTVEASVIVLSTDTCFMIGKSGRWHYSYANWDVGIFGGKLFIALGVSGNSSTGYGSQVLAIFSDVIPIGQHHIAFVIDGTEAIGYLDGAVVMQGTCSAMPSDNYPGEFYIGTQPELAGYNPRGVIVDEIRITRDVIYSGPFTPPAPGSMSSYVYPAIPVQQVALLTPCFRVFVGNGNEIPALKDYGFIEGTVKNSGIPVSDQRVACFDNNHNLIDEVKSGPDGSYRFNNLPRLNGDTYVVMARDSNGLLSPATADNRIPEAYA